MSWSLPHVLEHIPALHPARFHSCFPMPRKKQCGLQPQMMCKETSILALGCPRWTQLVLSLVLN